MEVLSWIWHPPRKVSIGVSLEQRRDFRVSAEDRTSGWRNSRTGQGVHLLRRKSSLPSPMKTSKRTYCKKRYIFKITQRKIFISRQQQKYLRKFKKSQNQTFLKRREELRNLMWELSRRCLYGRPYFFNIFFGIPVTCNFSSIYFVKCIFVPFEVDLT